MSFAVGADSDSLGPDAPVRRREAAALGEHRQSGRAIRTLRADTRPGSETLRAGSRVDQWPKRTRPSVNRTDAEDECGSGGADFCGSALPAEFLTLSAAGFGDDDWRLFRALLRDDAH